MTLCSCLLVQEEMAPMGATEYRGLMESQGDRDYRVRSLRIHSMTEICFHFSLASLSLFNNENENTVPLQLGKIFATFLYCCVIVFLLLVDQLSIKREKVVK